MRPRQPTPVALGPAVAAGPRADHGLRLVDDGAGADREPDGALHLLERLTGHIRVAEGLGIAPLTIEERAAAMLENACEGWRLDRRCREGGMLIDAPHQFCLRAQYHHDVLLLEHGLLNHERTSR